METNDRDNDTAGVAVRPPLLFLAGLAAGIAVEFLWPLGAGLANAHPAQIGAGLVLAVVGAVLMAAAMRRFAAAGTNVPTVLPSTALVTTGIYARSRNPIYLGLTAIYAGLAVALNAWWSVLLLVPVLVIMQVGVIKREERYLERKFGDAYRDYSSRVRRWL